MLPIWVYEICPYPLHTEKCLGKQHEFKKILLNIFVKRLSQLPKRGRLKALVWFWIIDEIYGLIPELSV
jgi:hypothetical protein